MKNPFLHRAGAVRRAVACTWQGPFSSVGSRVVRRGGLAHRLYADLERKSRVVAPLLTCEVNLRPHNAASLRFHAREGFAQVGTQKTDNGRKTVALLMKHLR